jgi:hypothetical protein
MRFLSTWLDRSIVGIGLLVGAGGRYVVTGDLSWELIAFAAGYLQMGLRWTLTDRGRR